MPELQRLSADHEVALRDFELANRSYFARSISDRGEEYFDSFADHHAGELAEQEAGGSAFYVLVADDGAIVGRFNLRRIDNGSAVLGYRVAQHVAGRGVATEGVERLCREAAETWGVHVVRAATSDANLASRRVLEKAGFVLVGPAEPADIGGQQGSWWERRLSSRPPVEPRA